MTFKDDVKGGVTVDKSIPLVNIGMIGLMVLGWVIYGVRVDDQIKDNTETIVVNSIEHRTEFDALDLKFEALDDAYNAQAVAVGVIQATVEFNREELSDINDKLDNLGSNR